MVVAMAVAVATAASPTTSPPPNRAYVTLLARGTGSYISPKHNKLPIVPDYVTTALPLLCSFARVGSAYPLFVLVHNLAAAEHARLRAHGASDIIDIADSAREEAARHGREVAPAAARIQCLLNSTGAWVVHGRGDFAQTMLKLLLWRELAARNIDQTIFVDADMIFLRPPDKLFTALTPPPKQSGRAVWWRKRLICPRPASDLTATVGRIRPLCSELDFVAPESSRSGAARQWDRDRTQCQLAGWQSGFFLTRTSVQIADALFERAASGNYSAFTRTEQDVIDAGFDQSEHCLRPSESTEHPQPACTRHAVLDRNQAYRWRIDMPARECIDSLPARARRHIPLTSLSPSVSPLCSCLWRSYVFHHKVHAYAPKAGGYGMRQFDVTHSNAAILNVSWLLCTNTTELASHPPRPAPLMSGWGGGLFYEAQKLAARSTERILDKAASSARSGGGRAPSTKVWTSKSNESGEVSGVRLEPRNPASIPSHAVSPLIARA